MSATRVIKTAPLESTPGISSPLDISGCVLWLDAKNVGAGTDPSPSNGDEIATWRDGSGQGRDAVSVGSGSTRPVFLATGLTGQPTLSIDGSRHGFRLQSALPAGPYTLVFAGQQTSDSFYLVDSGPPNRMVYWLNKQNTTNWYYQGAFKGSPGIAATAITYAVWLLDQTRQPTAELRIGGTSVRNDSTYENESFEPISFGSRFAGENLGDWAGLMSEWIVYNQALSSSEILQVESYLAQKWGII